MEAVQEDGDDRQQGELSMTLSGSMSLKLKYEFGDQSVQIRFEDQCMKVELADGTELNMDITTAEIEFMGEVLGSRIIFGPEGAEPILGVTALESAGIELDPRSQRLKKLPSIRLK